MGDCAKDGGLIVDKNNISATEACCVCGGGASRDYSCVRHKACEGDQYQEDRDWTYLSRSTGDCTACKALCDNHDGCTGYECGDGYCAGWLNGICSRSDLAAVSESSDASTCLLDGVSAHKKDPQESRYTCRANSMIEGTADLTLSSGQTSQNGFTRIQCENECSSNQKCKSV